MHVKLLEKYGGGVAVRDGCHLVNSVLYYYSKWEVGNEPKVPTTIVELTRAFQMKRYFDFTMDLLSKESSEFPSQLGSDSSF